MATTQPDFRRRLGGITKALLTGRGGGATMREAFKKLGPCIASLRPPVFPCVWPAPRSPVLAMRMPFGGGCVNPRSPHPAVRALC